MSLIEQAAKRLEVLRRAGADLREETSQADAQARAIDETPTPEAVIRALEARTPQSHPPLEPREERGETRTVPREEVRPVSQPLRPHVAIDLARLAARGFLTPNSPKSQLADEFRVVKRPIIRNALDKNGSKNKRRNLVMVTSALRGQFKDCPMSRAEILSLMHHNGSWNMKV